MLDPEIILGPPGTGKTTALIRILEEELATGTVPERVGFVSFTRKAATEAATRSATAMSLPASRFPWFRTLHSLCFRVLGLSSSQVLEGRRLAEFGEWIGVEIQGRYSLDEGATFGFGRGDRILFLENLSRVKGIPLREQYDEDSDEQSWWEVDRVSRALEKFKEAHQLMDYTDMLRVFVDQDWSPPLDVLLVDEAQDLSWLQWRVVEKLAAGCRRVVVAGDDDQAIYNWAGAAVDHFVDLPGRVTVLGQSWRVPQRVQAVADRIIERVAHRRPKTWAAREEPGEVEEADLADIDWTGPDILVLARNVKFIEQVQAVIRSSGYLYEYRGHPSVRESLRQAILTWERLRRGEAQTVDAVLRIYEQMSSGTGVARGHKSLPAWPREAEVTLADLRDRGGLLRDDVWHDALDRVVPREREYIRACLRRREVLSRPPRIRISTIHGAKGGEADHVVLLTDMATRTYQEAARAPDDEARVWYVAVTRTRQKLTIVRPRSEKRFAISLAGSMVREHKEQGDQ